MEFASSVDSIKIDIHFHCSEYNYFPVKDSFDSLSSNAIDSSNSFSFYSFGLFCLWKWKKTIMYLNKNPEKNDVIRKMHNNIRRVSGFIQFQI